MVDGDKSQTAELQCLLLQVANSRTDMYPACLIGAWVVALIRIHIDRDIEGWTPPPGMLVDLGSEIEDRKYNQADMDRVLVLNKRTKLVAERVMEFLYPPHRFDAKLPVYPLVFEVGEDVRFRSNSRHPQQK